MKTVKINVSMCISYTVCFRSHHIDHTKAMGNTTFKQISHIILERLFVRRDNKLSPGI